MQVGRYRFLDRLAVGGMAEVFVAVAQGSEGFEKPVVIKRLLPELARMHRFQQMFLDEARTMLNLQHGNIVQILDMGRMEGVPFLTLEYVHGKDLRTILQRAEERGRKMPQSLSAHIVREVCRALDYAHRKTDDEGRPLNIVHRDVNPANILVSHDGEVKVSDFGLAKARDNLEQSDAGVIKGKLSYLSPEQASGKPVDNRHDIFSLGTTLYEMVCHVRPFEARTDVEVVRKIVEADFPMPSEVVHDVRAELEAVILRALKKEPAQRYQTAYQMREDLSRYLQQIMPAPPGDRELADFVNELFPERRSNSSLFRLIPIAQLPPPMTASDSRGDGLSEFHQTNTPLPADSPPPLHGLAPVAGVIEPGRGERPGAAPTDRMSRPPGRLEPPRAAAGVISNGRPEVAAPGGSLWIVVMLVAALALGGGGFLLYRQLRPSTPLASLTVTSTPPGAAVLLDGVDTGQRTPAVLLDLPVQREVVVQVRLKNAPARERRLRFDHGGPHAFHFDLEPRRETLTVSSEPESCDVLVDGELRGQAPLELQLGRGRKYSVELRKKGYLGKLVQHYAEREKDHLHIALEAETTTRPAKPRVGVVRAPRAAPTAAAGGTLEILTELEAKVFIDDRLAGRTPGFRVTLPAGTYRLLVVPDGTKMRHAATITVAAGRTNRLTLTSTPTP